MGMRILLSMSSISGATTTEVLLNCEEPIDVPDRRGGVWVIAEQIAFSHDGVDDGGEVHRKTGASGEEAC